MQQMKETPQETARRLLLNTWVKVKGVSSKSQFLVQQKIKEHELHERKKSFGVTYMNLLQQKADPTQLEACVSTAQADAEDLMDTIRLTEAAIKELDEDTQAKLIVEPNSYSG